MTAQKSIGRPAHTMKIVKFAITIGAVVLTSLGSLALNDEQTQAGSSEPIAMSIPDQLIDGARDVLSPLASWLAEPDEGTQTCTQQASAQP